MDGGLYEIVPGFIAAWLAIVLVSNATAGSARPAVHNA
jgi:SSS family solute:Na+ symporter